MTPPSRRAASLAAGTLGQIIPPSIVLILLGDVISNAYQEASQLAQGVYSPEPVSVGDLFAGALVPGLTLVGLYMLYLILMAIFRGRTSPAVPVDERFAFGEAVSAALKTLPAPLLLIVAVLGSILAGKATATEAARRGGCGGASHRRGTTGHGKRGCTLASQSWAVGDCGPDCPIGKP